MGNLKTKCGHLDLLFGWVAKVERKVGVKAVTFSYGLTSLTDTGIIEYARKKTQSKDSTLILKINTEDKEG